MNRKTLSLATAAASIFLACSCPAAELVKPVKNFIFNRASSDVPHYALKDKPKKLIHFGWCEPKTINHFLKPIEELDRNCPVDGIGIRPTFQLKRNGKIINYSISRALGSPQTFTHEDFAEWIPALKRLQQTRMKHNFVLTGSVLFNADWFDDAAWERTMNNFENLAWFAKQADFEGICLDIEAYPHSGKPFRFRPELGHSFKDTLVQVRKRGADWIARINKQFPDLVLFTFFWTSQCDSAYAAAHPERHYMGDTGLQNAFFNGVYDAAPDTMKIIDGNENKGYNSCVEADFQAATSAFLRYGKAWIDPRNHAKFDKITQQAIALYVDSYVPRPNARNWNLFEKTDNPTALLCQNIELSLKYSDEYAWVWAEKGTFWPTITGTKDILFWNDRLPMATEAIEAGKSPVAAAMKYAGKNILVNSSLEPGDSGKPEGPGQTPFGVTGWAQYQNPAVKAGQILAENGAVHFKDCQSACITQATGKIKPGQRLILSARAKVENVDAQPTMSYFFRDAKGLGLWKYTGYANFEPDQDGWMKATVVFCVPNDNAIAKMTVTCGASGFGKGTSVIVDDIELKPVVYPWDK